MCRARDWIFGNPSSWREEARHEIDIVAWRGNDDCKRIERCNERRVFGEKTEFREIASFSFFDPRDNFS